MTLFEKFKYKLSTSLKFVAILSILFQLVAILFLIFKVYIDVLFLFIILFYFFIIVIGFSRYVEVKSKNGKEKVINFFWLLNCFPFIIGVLASILFVLMSFFSTNSAPTKIDPEDINFIVIDSNGNQIKKDAREMKFDIKNKKLVDSIIQVKTKE